MTGSKVGTNMGSIEIAWPDGRKGRLEVWSWSDGATFIHFPVATAVRVKKYAIRLGPSSTAQLMRMLGGKQERLAGPSIVEAQ